ncbi:DNA cytosine methyltransferase [Mycoplasmopsis lipophila]|uniref:DNA cytosine methyltransferase n=1 Tax=Mycoplasmopsis lipophila TaxID=2117 RepID=UPI0038730413
MKDIKMVDLFAGAGGLTLGFVQTDFKILDTIEFWKPAVETYNFNFSTNIVPRDITDDDVRNELELKCKNKTNLVIGGFPCQGYSMAGKRDPDDQRNQLYKYTIDVIKRLQPEVFVLENVKGILSFKEKDGELVINKIINILKEQNYYARYILVDSSKFGVPQKRERVIFIGSKDKNKVDLAIIEIAKHNEKIKTVRDAISHLENQKMDSNIPNHIFSNHTTEMKERLSKLKEGESLYGNYSDAFKRIYYDKPSPTVKENHGGVHVHPVLNRVLTPKELALLQSFPDNFVFQGTKTNI